MAFIATLLLMIALGIVARTVIYNSRKRSETETDRMMRRLLADKMDDEPDAPEEVKEARRPPLSALIEKKLQNMKMLQQKDGQAFMGHIKERLVLSGQEDTTPERWLAGAMTIWILGLLIPFLAWLSTGMSAVVIVPVMLFFAAYPILKLKSQVTARQDNIRREVPFFIQQLYMTMSSGMTVIDDAILRVAKTSEDDPYDNILAREFARAQTEYRLGGLDREQALRGVSRRTGVSSVENLVEAIIQGLRTGADMSYVLGEYASQARRMWVQDMRTFKAKKEPLVTLGVILTMFGALLLFSGALLLRIFQMMSGLG